jgi:putative SOS response-associated peptidase YedK
MCNEYQSRVKLGELRDRFLKRNIPFQWVGGEPNRSIDEPIKPTDRATIIRPVDPSNVTAGIEGLSVRWWLVPPFHRGALKDWRSMCTNARLETVDTAPTFRDAYKLRRCLVPLTSFIEYSEPVGWKKGQPKTRNEIDWDGGEPRYFAGLWERSTPSDMPQGIDTFAFITGPAPPDVAAIHDRSPPVLTLDQGLEWLRLDGPGKAPLYDLVPAGSFRVRHSPREQIMSAEMRRTLL